MILPLLVATLVAGQTADSCSGTIPQPPSAEQLSALRTMGDVIAVTVLPDGSLAPKNVVLPSLVNRRQTLEYMRVNYPKKRKKSDARPIAWVCVDKRGRVANATLLNGTGDAAIDSLSLKVFSVAAFAPAYAGSDTLAVWFPLPAIIPSKDELIAALASDGFDRSTVPTNMPFTEAPVLQNRSRIESAILRVIHHVNPQAAQRAEMQYRSQQIGGTTIMWIYIDATGNVTNSMIKKSSGNHDLDASAQQIVASMRFFPAKLNGKPVDVWIEVPLAFKAR